MNPLNWFCRPKQSLRPNPYAEMPGEKTYKDLKDSPEAEDMSWQTELDCIQSDAMRLGFCDQDMWIAWRLGASTLVKLRDLGAVLPHDPSAPK